MRFRALAIADDVLVAEEGEASVEALEALVRMRRAGRRVVLTTFRELELCMTSLPTLDAFDAIVVEGGAVLYLADPPREYALAPVLPRGLVPWLEAWGLRSLSFGRVAIAARRSDAWSVPAAVARVRRAGFEAAYDDRLGELVVVPAGVDIARGTRTALQHLGCAPRSAAGVVRGAHASLLFSACGHGIAVADAAPLLRASADHVTSSPGPHGIVELCAVADAAPLLRTRADSPDGPSAASPVSTRRARSRVPD